MSDGADGLPARAPGLGVPVARSALWMHDGARDLGENSALFPLVLLHYFARAQGIPTWQGGGHLLKWRGASVLVRALCCFHHFLPATFVISAGVVGLCSGATEVSDAWLPLRPCQCPPP